MADGRVITATCAAWRVPIVRTKNNPQVNHGHVHQQTRQTERVFHFEGKVYCLTVPGHVFYTRRNGVATWTGNSSRSGNKGIVSEQITRADMPYCTDGLIPDLLVSSHSITTRMAPNQMIENLVGILGAVQGSIVDASTFGGASVRAIIAQLEAENIRFAGHRQMYSGMTGEPIDTLIFIGPTCYQRPQKFVEDEQYAVQAGPTMALTRQPLDGRAHRGGLRLGEMEVWVFSAQGTMRALDEKLYKDSDGIDIYVCAVCQQQAIVNAAQGMYKCSTCGDAAEIKRVRSSWTANLSLGEMSAMNAKVFLETEPHQFNTQREAE
jgi:DNA-directed RNA polymerase beta subunit